MKKRIAMRVASLALCAVFTGMLFGAPKSKAVVAETAIGTAAVASYFQATGLTMAASAGSTGALISTGVADIAGSYAMATGAASSGSAFLSSVAAGVSISPAGALVLTAAAVVAIGALVAWYVHENGLEEEGDTATPLPGTSDTYSYNGLELPSIDLFWVNKTELPFAIIYTRADNGAICCEISNVMTFVDEANGKLAYSSSPVSCAGYVLSGSSWVLEYNVQNNSFVSSIGYLSNIASINWTNYDLFCDDGSLSLSSSNPVAVGNVEEQVVVVRTSEFTQPDTEFDAESQKEMVIDLGFVPGITLDEFADVVPDQIAAGTLAPTYEITSTETGEGTDTETQPDEETGIYIPILSDIKTRLNTLADSIVDGIMDGLTSLFVPSEAYLEALPQQITDTFEERTGFLTYPFSLLPEFVDRLSASSSDWILRWPQIVEPFSNTVLFQAGSFNVSGFMRNNGQIKALYDLYRLMAKVFMSFGFVSLCYNKYRSVVGDDYGGM